MRLVEKLRRIAAPAASPVPVRSVGRDLPGEEVPSAAGPYWVRRVRYPLRHRHGAASLKEIRRTPAQPPPS